jgi:hypothetical protein
MNEIGDDDDGVRADPIGVIHTRPIGGFYEELLSL